MDKRKAEIEKDLLAFHNEILENQDSYEKIYSINRRIFSYYIINHLTSEDMRIFEDHELMQIQNRATDHWFASLLNKDEPTDENLSCEEQED